MNLNVKDAKEIYFGRGGKRSKDLGTVMIRGASIIFVGQDREKLIFAQDDEEKLLHREEIEFPGFDRVIPFLNRYPKPTGQKTHKYASFIQKFLNQQDFENLKRRFEEYNAN